MRTTRPFLVPSLRNLAVMAAAGCALAPWLPPGVGLALLWLLQRLARLRDAAQPAR